MADRTYVDRLLKRAQEAFSTFKTKREGYADLVHRDWPATIDPRLGLDIAHYETPDLEESEQDFADILTMNPTRFSASPGEQGSRAKDDIDDLVLWASRTWNIENRGRWIDRAIGIGQARDGVKVIRMLHHPIEDAEDEEAMKKRPHPWFFEDVPTLACAWLDKGTGQTFFAAETEMPLVEAQETLKVDGKYLESREGYSKGKKYIPTIDGGSLGWVGDADMVDKTMWEKKIKVITIEYQDLEAECPVCPDKHKLWKGMELVCASGKEKEAELVNEYTLPYKHAGTYRVVAGRKSNDRDPHHKYRPLMFRLYVEASVMNWALTTLQTLANRDSYDDRVYASLAKLSDAVAARIPEEFMTAMSMPLPDASKNEIPIVPGELLKWPTNMAEVLVQVYQDARERFERAKPNRFLVGEAFQETQEGTGTAVGLQQQQARLPFGWLLSQTDTFILQAKEDQLHAMRYWAYDSEGEETKFYASLTGDEPVKGLSPESGKWVYASASKAERQFELVLLTENETLQEQQLKQAQALQLHDKGWIDAEQTVERLGFYDTDQQLRKLAKYRLKQSMAPVKLGMQQAVLATIASAVADIDPMLLQHFMGGGMASPQPPGAGPQVQPPQPNVRLPALSGVSGGAQPVQGAMG